VSKGGTVLPGIAVAAALIGTGYLLAKL